MTTDRVLQYGFVKHLEHFWKGLSSPKSQISPVPPDEYGERFINFITGITMTEEEAERRKTSEAGRQPQSREHPVSAGDDPSTSLEITGRSSHSDRCSRSPADKTVSKAQKQAEKSERRGANEQAVPDYTLRTIRSPSAERSHGQAGSTLPVIEEAGKAGSTSDKSGASVAGNAIDEKERARARDDEIKGSIRRVVSDEHQQPMIDKADGSLDAPVPPRLSTSPSSTDAEKTGREVRPMKPEELKFAA